MKTKIKNTPVHEGKWIEKSSNTHAFEGDPLAIEAIDYLEVYSGNARQSAYFFVQGFGFTPVAYRGPETGYRESATYVLQQGKITILITSPMQRDSEIATFTLNHGDSVRDVAIRTADCEAFYYETMRRGAQSVLAPTEWADDHGVIRRAAIKTYGDVVHSIVDRSDYNGCFMPGFVPYSDLFPVTKTGEDVGLLTVDHVVGNVEFGEMNTWVKFYEDVLGFNQFKHFSDDDIQTEYTALMSKVMTNGNNKIKFPINEPAQGKRKSQIEEYLDFHNGPGVQHVAMLTGDIVKSVSALRDRGLNFLYVPETYYEELIDRVGKIDEDPKSLEPLGILVDRDDDGYLLQLFTRPVVDKPTLFFEIIQRKGSQGFGLGNFKALFESIEREQERRGNL